MRVNGLITTFRYRKKDIPVVDGVSFEVYEGKTPGIVGEYGCGKAHNNGCHPTISSFTPSLLPAQCVLQPCAASLRHGNDRLTKHAFYGNIAGN